MSPGRPAGLPSRQAVDEENPTGRNPAMRKLISTTFVTLDGVMQAPGGPDEDASEGFTSGGWSVNFWDDTMNAAMADIMGHPFDLLLGRKTYDIFAAFWPEAPEAEAKPLNDATKYVASRGTPELSWKESVLLQGDLVEAVTALKAGEGPELQVHGSGDLLQTLIRHNLIDEYHVWTFPVVVGHGRRLFAAGTVPAALRLADTTVSGTGVVIGTYRPAGELVVGSF
jgi:dihydrofolate reductase